MNNLDSKIKINSKGSTLQKIGSLVKFRMVKFLNSDLSKLIKRKSQYNIYGQDHLFFSHPFLDKMTLIEDGLANYTCVKRSLYSYLLLPHKIFGKSKKIKNILLTGLSSYPPKLEKKITTINLKEKWGSLHENNKNKINDIFNYKKTSNKKYDVLILTQPISEYSLVSESEKLSIYKKIIQLHSENSENTLLRIHPREKTDYSKLGYNIKINNEPYPIEILLLNTHSFKKAITLYSTAIYSLSCDEKIIYGTSLSSALEKKIGYIPYQEIIS
ncbi:hypothetical protein NUITMVP1_30750 [Proteus mirabilis]|uniref:glycosyltransferase family 52 protein n=1 Tax=Enterobacterales TaxID=91347 RepID=UPI001F0FD94C|nr:MULTISPECIES: glycosyltransferase family 52 protein [Enterobacterales]MCH4716284.1 glycosyltransferase family 52 protein [Escherichia coli]BDR99166.1 hypothetical protein NUITMVP1_30750 [Proteus mirabilis]